MKNDASGMNDNFSLIVKNTFYPYLLPHFYKLAGRAIALLGLILLCYNRILPSKFQIPKDTASMIFTMIMILGLSFMAFSREKEESQKIKDKRVESSILGVIFTAAIWFVHLFFIPRGLNSIQSCWNYLWDTTQMPDPLDTTKVLIKVFLTFLVCKAILFFIYLKTKDETENDQEEMLQARSAKQGNDEGYEEKE